MLHLVSTSPQVLTLTTQRLYILQYYIFESQKAQFKAIIFISKGPCASCYNELAEHARSMIKDTGSHGFVISFYNGGRDIILESLPKY